jgi:hypothetical protein
MKMGARRGSVQQATEFYKSEKLVYAKPSEYIYTHSLWDILKLNV